MYYMKADYADPEVTVGLAGVTKAKTLSFRLTYWRLTKWLISVIHSLVSVPSVFSSFLK